MTAADTTKVSQSDVGVFVLGMHRSGTSAATRLVNLLGVPLSRPHDVMSRPVPDNLKGYWESAALVVFNQELLEHLGGGTWDIPELDPDWHRRLDASLSTRARETFYSVYESPQWLWKDPRNCVTLPFWLDALRPRAICLVVFRHPLEVAQSLGGRDRFTTGVGVAFWELYTRHLLKNISGIPTLISAYDDLLRDPILWCEQAADFLRSEGVLVESVPHDSVRDFIDPNLRNTAATSECLEHDPAVSDAVRSIYEFLLSSRGGHKQFTPPDLPPATSWAPLVFAEHRNRIAARDKARHAELELRRMRTAWESDRLEQAARIAFLEEALQRLLASKSLRYTAPLRSAWGHVLRLGRHRRRRN